MTYIQYNKVISKFGMQVIYIIDNTQMKQDNLHVMSWKQVDKHVILMSLFLN